MFTGIKIRYREINTVVGRKSKDHPGTNWWRRIQELIKEFIGFERTDTIV